MPKMGLQMEVKLSTGALSTMAPQESSTVNNMMPRPTSPLLMRSSGITRRSRFIASPWQASRKPR
ncbi:hypothetical protein D3C80_1796850 [compost metagenome]